MAKKVPVRKTVQRHMPQPDRREVAVAQVTDNYSSYPSNGLTPQRLAEIFREADGGDVMRQAELFEEMEEKDPAFVAIMEFADNK